VAPLIQVGVGFHRELTGRENIYVNGAILGLTRRQIDDRLEQIIDFAEVDDFIDTPVKFYSSGMFVRLGFAVAVHSDPNILIVDEVLAVGDLAFQVKCYERMNELRERGTTVVMVSHHLGLIRRMCERVLLVHNGVPQHLGSAEDSIAAFHHILSSESEMHTDASGLRFEPQVVEITSVELLGPTGVPTAHLDAGHPATVRVKARAQQAVDDLVVATTLYGPDGNAIYADSSAGRPFGAVEAGSEFSWTMAFRSQLPTGSYQIGVRIDRADLRTTLAQHPALSFFVTGRHTVAGVADLEAVFARDEALRVTDTIDLEWSSAKDVAL
jgi:energy-coupling factor transporter ATP-binding protein EcfA2